jgi:hypothetical protein
VYSHIQSMKFAGLWPEDLEDKFFLLLGLVNFETTAAFQNKSGGKLHVSTLPLSLGGLTRGYVLGGAPADVQVKYLHGTTVPGDYLTLWFKSHMIMLGYGRGDCDDSGTLLYGKQEWVEQNSGWLQEFTSMDINAATRGYALMYPAPYKVNFVYGPKFTWAAAGPWIKKDLWYGVSPIQNIPTTVKLSSVNTFLTATTTTNSPTSLLKKTLTLKVNP